MRMWFPGRSDRPLPEQSNAGAERRITARHDFIGCTVTIATRAGHFTLNLKDISRTGLCGLTDAPLAAGEMVQLLFKDADPLPAEICWIRRAFIGARFPEPLNRSMLQKLRRFRKARRSAAEVESKTG